jgi:S-adenosylmethionine hydrolase
MTIDDGRQPTANGQRSSPIITLLTDFGLEDEYVGVMKGVILSINPAVQIVDITHNIARHNLEQASLVLNASFRYFPRGSIHVIVVDPGVGGARQVICLERGGHLFLAPDNGVLTMVIEENKVERVCAVQNEELFLIPVSDTFHGRDIFAPVAAYLSKGLSAVKLGKEIVPADLARFDRSEPAVSDSGELFGRVMAVDHFGNVITNIDRARFEAFRGDVRAEDMVIGLEGTTILGVVRSYDQVKRGSPVAIFGSRDFLEVSVNQGNAFAQFKIRIGQTVYVSRPGKSDGR